MSTVLRNRLLILAVVVSLPGVLFVYDRYWEAELAVDSNPAGALVRIDGRGVGLTPLTLYPEAGRHLLSISHSHYLDHEESMVVRRGDRLVRMVTLNSGLGQLSLLSSPPGAWIEVDGVAIEAVTPTEVKFATGPAMVKMGMTERHPVEKEVIVLPDQTIEVNLDLNIAPHGALIVSVIPNDASISLPELQITYRSGVRIPVGEQLIRVSRVGYEAREIRHAVHHGDNFTRVELTRALGLIEVQSDPRDARISLTYEQSPMVMTTVDYQPGLRLPIGRVEVRGRALGFRTAFNSFDLTTAGHRISMRLQTMDIQAGERFRDPLNIGSNNGSKKGEQGPLLVVVPAGEFQMGDANGPPSVNPVRTIGLTEPFAITVYEISVKEYVSFATATATATGADLDRRLEAAAEDEPARYLTWKEAYQYADWLTEQSGFKYRLPTEAEWEYVARAGTSTAYEFGDDPSAICGFGNLADHSTRELYREWDVADCDDGHQKLAPVGSFLPNGWGLHDMYGNVAEWVLECGMPDYRDASEDGSVVNTGQNCRTHAFRGGSWDSQPEGLRSSRRGSGRGRGDDRGIRLLREL